jgi:hypothetical protein
MSTSGTTDFGSTELNIITDALIDLGVKQSGQALNADDVVVMRRKLNMIVKQWSAQVDFAPGLKMWTRRRAYLFLQADQVGYDIGPSGDECASETYYSTTLSAAASAAASTVTLASVSGVADAMRIGIELASGSMQWTTVSGAPSGSVVTLTDALTGAADSGAQVYVYESKPLRPFEIVTAVMRNSAGQDTPMDPNLSVEEYEQIPNKSGTGTPSRIYFEAKKTNARVYLDRSPDDLSKVIRFVYLSYIEDTTAQTEDVDFPAEWHRALGAQLVVDGCDAFGKKLTKTMQDKRDEALRMAQNAYPSKSTAYYQMDADE